MAVFTSKQLNFLMDHVCKNTTTQSWTKAQVSAALQAIEDRMQLPATKSAISSDIETAAPGIFTANQKDLLFSVWSISYAIRQGVL